MALLFTKGKNPKRKKIVLIHNRPSELPEERQAEGFQVDEMPEKDEVKLADGYRSLPYLNEETGEVWYEYVKTQEKKDSDKLSQLEDRITQLEAKLK